MTKFACPACGAELVFQSSVSVFCVCKYCGSSVLRRDLKVEDLGKMAQLPADMSPFQLGTRGIHEGKPFTIVGRLKIAWEEGGWNEWFLAFDTGGSGWLGEAQGQYMITQPAEISPLPAREAMRVGATFTWNKTTFQVEDIKNATCVGSEGELPMPAPQGRRSLSVDLNSPGNLFATLDFSDEGTRLYLGKYAEFDSFRFTQLRQLDGW